MVESGINSILNLVINSWSLLFIWDAGKEQECRMHTGCGCRQRTVKPLQCTTKRILLQTGGLSDMKRERCRINGLIFIPDGVDGNPI